MVKPSNVPPLKRFILEIDWKRSAGSRGYYCMVGVYDGGYRSSVCLSEPDAVVVMVRTYLQRAKLEESFPSCIITEKAREKLLEKNEEISELFSRFLSS
jgi:hypothetical protein